jgi:hypothetical protein
MWHSNAYWVLVRKPEGGNPLARPGYIWKKNTRVTPKEMHNIFF